MKYLFRTFIACIIVFSMQACQKTISEQLIESYEELAAVMSYHLDDPETLIAEMNRCIDKNQALWHKSHTLLESRDEDSVTREFEMHESEIQALFLKIVNLDLEIQDTLLDKPEMMRQYSAAVQRIGRTE